MASLACVRRGRPHRLTAREFDDDAGEDGDGGDAGTRKRARTERAGSAETKSGEATTTGRAGSRTPKKREVHRARGGGEWDVRWEGRERRDEEVGYCERARGGGAAGGGEADTEETVGACNFERAAEVLVSLSPQINREAVRAAQQASPARNYAKNQIIDLALGKPVTPRRKRAQLFPDEDFSSAPAARRAGRQVEEEIVDDGRGYALRRARWVDDARR